MGYARVPAGQIQRRFRARSGVARGRLGSRVRPPTDEQPLIAKRELAGVFERWACKAGKVRQTGRAHDA